MVEMSKFLIWEWVSPVELARSIRLIAESLSIEPQLCDLFAITWASFSFTAKVGKPLFSTETTLAGHS